VRRERVHALRTVLRRIASRNPFSPAMTALPFRRRLTIAPLLLAFAAGIGCAAPPPAMPPAGTVAAPAAAMPPSASAANAVAVVNPGFESSLPGIDGNPEGWYSYQHAGPVSYKISLDADVVHGGRQSVRIDNIGPEIYGTLAQIVRGPQFAGKTVRFTAWLKTRGVTGNGWSKGTGLALTVYAGGQTVAGTNFRKSAFGGTTDWTRHQTTVVAPAGTERVDIEISLTGPGTVWVDDVSLEVLPAAPR
jgi:hypothetical protein